MSTSTYIARLIGPLFLIMGLGMVVEGDTVRALSQEFLSNLSLIYLAGMLALVAGLAIVNAHNLWVADWRVLITLLGWLSIAGGIFRLLFPGKVQALGTGLVASPAAMIMGGIIVLTMGAILSFVGYEHLWQRDTAKAPAKTPAKSADKSADKTAAKPAAKSAGARKAVRKTTASARKTASPRKRS
ncbi:hypothetical protein AUC69_14310 [Methyloceanibacter superfactus]|jgi:hypothetical protein|uniref:Uncharacterized protein n=1 Tax=Methyloceanibacter superfactus TaxID=1774969 RepID=A0A1E3VTC4_9HYPH|nr:hypothetical protein [Methyloceanibacter superfactus]ODR96755.1 hypothetical protein AUC69_14310 [Methyloceanibacter superfactus]